MRRSEVHCYRCGYVWVPRRARVRICARCKSPYYWFAKIPVPGYGGGLGIAEVIGGERRKVLRAARRYGGTNVRVFGSVARRQATPSSDLDLLVDPAPSGRYRPVDLAVYLRKLLGRRVDLVTESSLHWLSQPRVIAEAVPL